MPLQDCILADEGLVLGAGGELGANICHLKKDECLASLLEDKLPCLAWANNLDFGPVPDCLKVLCITYCESAQMPSLTTCLANSPAELAAICAYTFSVQLVLLQAYGKPNHMAMVGLASSYLHNVTSLAATVPRAPVDLANQIQLVLLHPSDPTETLKHARQWSVSPAKVEKALDYLIEFNIAYKDRPVDGSVLRGYNGEVPAALLTEYMRQHPGMSALVDMTTPQQQTPASPIPPACSPLTASPVPAGPGLSPTLAVGELGPMRDEDNMMSGMVAPVPAVNGQVELSPLDENIANGIQGAHRAIVEEAANRGEHGTLMMHNILVDTENLAIEDHDRLAAAMEVLVQDLAGDKIAHTPEEKEQRAEDFKKRLLAITHGAEQQNTFDNPLVWAGAFPCFFPNGAGCPQQHRPVRISNRLWANWFMRQAHLPHTEHAKMLLAVLHAEINKTTIFSKAKSGLKRGTRLSHYQQALNSITADDLRTARGAVERVTHKEPLFTLKDMSLSAEDEHHLSDNEHLALGKIKDVLRSLEAVGSSVMGSSSYNYMVYPRLLSATVCA